MKQALLFCILLLGLSGTRIKTPYNHNMVADKQTCNLGLAPRLQVYYIKKSKKERLQCNHLSGYFKQAINNTLYFIGNDIFGTLPPCLK